MPAYQDNDRAPYARRTGRSWSRHELRRLDLAVAANIKARREALNMHPEALASALGISLREYLRCENGEARVGAGRLHDLARQFGVPVSHLFEGLISEEERRAAPAFAPRPSTGGLLVGSEGMRFARAYAQIGDPHTRKRIADLVRAFAGTD